MIIIILSNYQSCPLPLRLVSPITFLIWDSDVSFILEIRHLHTFVQRFLLNILILDIGYSHTFVQQMLTFYSLVYFFCVWTNKAGVSDITIYISQVSLIHLTFTYVCTAISTCNIDTRHWTVTYCAANVYFLFWYWTFT